jgi:hypothetical protein
LFDLVERPKIFHEDKTTNWKKAYNLFIFNGTVLAAGFTFSGWSAPASQVFNIPDWEHYVLTRISLFQNQFIRAGVINAISDLQLTLLNTNRNSLPDNFGLSGQSLQFQFQGEPQIEMRVPVFQNFTIQAQARLAGNFAVGDIVDAGIVTEFERLD